MMKSYRAFGLLLLIAASSPAAFAAGEPVDPVDVRARQKERLLGEVLSAPALSDRVRQSGKPEAQKQLDAARSRLEAGRAAVAAGRLDEAEKTFNQGLSEATRASLLAGQARDATRDAARVDELRAQMKAFLEAFARIRDEKGAAIDRLLDRGKVDQLVAQGERQAQAGQTVQAIASLDQAVSMAERAIAEARRNDTITSRREYATPADEYRDELERLRSYEMLIDLIQKQKEVSPAARQAMAAFIAKGQAARQEAEAAASRNDHAKAIQHIEQGVQALSQALREAGLMVPL